MGLRAFFAASLLGLATARPAHARGAMVKRQDEVYEEYDFVVVGAGTAGLTVADRLSEEGKCKIYLHSSTHPPHRKNEKP